MTVSIKNPSEGIGSIAVDGNDVLTLKSDGTTELQGLTSTSITSEGVSSDSITSTEITSTNITSTSITSDSISSPSLPKRINVEESLEIVANNEYNVILETGQVVLTFPESPNVGDFVKVVVLSDATVTLAPGTGTTITGNAEGLSLDLKNQRIELVFFGTDWVVVS